MKETDSVSVVKGIGEKAAGILAGMEIHTVHDLIHYYPRRYDSFEPPVLISRAEDHKVCAIRGTVIREPILRKGGRVVVTLSELSDGFGKVRLIWYRMPYVRNQIRRGDRLIVRGRFACGSYGPSLEQPVWYTEEEYSRLVRARQPVYALPPKMSKKSFRKWISLALEGTKEEEDQLPEWIRERYQLPGIRESLRQIHFPESDPKLIEARERLVFDEFYGFMRGIRGMRARIESIPNRYVMTKHDWADRLLAALPYGLTGAQCRVWKEIRQDLSGTHLMNRLVQGDVGSGKTILAQLALVLAAENGYQGALMVPTEVLARQHMESFHSLFEKAGIPMRCCLLTGSMTAKEKREIRKRIEEHEADVVIGTHALIQESVVFSDLALAVTDEQHRFGVKQRDKLSGKGEDTHVLVMSATPIPRTLAIMVYGDMDISAVDELPGGRKKIKNCVVGPEWRPKAYGFLRKKIEEGRQAYVICPLVEESEGLFAENVLDYAEKLRMELPPSIVIETLHGQMNPKEKNRRMERFLAGEIDILVSTTVIEVGVNVPNAAVMMVENAERFGLAALHQLRGRVGRGEHQSYCIFVDGSGDAEKNQRLSILNQSNDGFEIAQEDLRLRGPGDIFGIRQSGELSFSLGDIYTDAEIMRMAAEAAGVDDPSKL